jgi:hypothetical protein
MEDTPSRQMTTEERASQHPPLIMVFDFRSQFSPLSPLDELVRHGAQQMLQPDRDEVGRLPGPEFGA